jgi:hypothetical protein
LAECGTHFIQPKTFILLADCSTDRHQISKIVAFLADQPINRQKREQSLHWILMRLFHMTSIANAVSILRKQEMHAGSHGLCGPGIYFGSDPGQLCHKARAQGVILSAQVDLGNIMIAQKSHCHPGEDWAGILDARGHDSVRCTGLASGDEYIVYEAWRVTSITLHTASPHFFTGTLQVSADGRSGTGRSFSNYQVNIVTINQRPSWPYPVLLGDAYSNQLGWVAPESLRLG